MPRKKPVELRARKSTKREDRSNSTDSSDDYDYPSSAKMDNASFANMDFEEASENSEGWSDDDGLTSEEDLPIRPKNTKRGLADSESDLLSDLAAASTEPKVSASATTRPAKSVFYPKMGSGEKAAPLSESPLVKRLSNFRSFSSKNDAFDLEDDDDDDEDESPLGTAPYMAKRENSAGRNIGQVASQADNRPPSPPMSGNSLANNPMQRSPFSAPPSSPPPNPSQNRFTSSPQNTGKADPQSLSPKLPVRVPEVAFPVSEAETDPSSYIGYRTSNAKKGIVPRSYVPDPSRIDPNENPDAYFAARNTDRETADSYFASRNTDREIADAYFAARNADRETAAAIEAGANAAREAPIDPVLEEAPIMPPKSYFAPRANNYGGNSQPEAARTLPSVAVYYGGSSSRLQSNNADTTGERDPEASLPSVSKLEDNGETEYSDDRRGSDTISLYSFKKDGGQTFWALIACLACALILLAALLGGILSSILINDNPAPTPIIVEEVATQAPTTLIPSQSPTEAPSTYPTISGFRPRNQELFDKIVAALPAGDDDIREEGTPQNRAYQWLEADAALQDLSDVKLVQRFALATFYYSTNGDEWFNNGSWLEALDECLWYTDSSTAFNCDGDIFTTLEFNKNNIGGTLPSELAMLTNLRTFNIINEPTGESAKVQGALPTELGLLSSMEFFSFKNQNLTGSIPPEMFLNWPVAGTVLIERCKLSGQIPTTIGLLSSATKISFRKNDLTGPIPIQVGDTPKMLQFSVDGNFLTGTIPTEFGKLTEAKGIWVNQNNLVGPIPNEFGNLKWIKAGLRFSNNQLTGTIPSSLGTLIDMKNFNAENNLLTGPVPDFSNLINLKEFRIEGNALTGEISNATCAIIIAQQAVASADCPTEVACACCENCPV